jgi:Asp-tRNA(Asn)/Glu-tRNA(Gln) amidotransferase C subunit
MEKINIEDIESTDELEEKLVQKINEIIDWINSQ